MSKVVVGLGYSNYIVDTKDAVALCEIMSKAERYEEKYNREEDGKPSFYTYHVWEQDGEMTGSWGFKLLPDGRYRLAKLAGKPEEKK